MMLRTRIGTTPDMARFANAVSRPGIDPRVWVSYGILTSDPYIETNEDEQDVFVDVMLLPSQQPETARVGAVYAGNGFGFYFPLKKDDEVLVCAPSGDPDEGLVITQRMWSPSDPPPTALTDHPEDVMLVVEPTKSVRIGVSGGGKVYLGDVEASRGVARLDDTTTNGTLSLTSAGGVATLNYLAPGAVTPAVIGSFTIAGTITPGSATVSGKIDAASEKVNAA